MATWTWSSLVGTVSNRSAIGAKVRVHAAIQGKTFWQLREIVSGDGWSSGSSLIAHFGLGDATRADLVRIEWPSGIVQELQNVAANQVLTATEPAQLEASSLGQVCIRSWKGMAFTVETSTDLRTWSPVSTVTNLTGTLTFADPTAVSLPRRFYRAVAK